MKIKPSRIGDITLSFTDIGKSCPFRDFYVANVSFNATRENKILAKISEFSVSMFMLIFTNLHRKVHEISDLYLPIIDAARFIIFFRSTSRLADRSNHLLTEGNLAFDVVSSEAIFRFVLEIFSLKTSTMIKTFVLYLKFN